MNRELLLSVSEAVLSRLDAGESPRKIVDALVRHYGATCAWQDAHWTLCMMRVSVDGSAVNSALLRAWCARADELAAVRPVMFDNMDAAKASLRKRRFKRDDLASLLPRIGLVPNATPGLDDCNDPHVMDFDGYSLVTVWGRFSFEIFLGVRP